MSDMDFWKWEYVGGVAAVHVSVKTFGVQRQRLLRDLLSRFSASCP